MEIKDIVVHADSSERTAERIQLATRMAADKDAHVTGIFAIPDPYTPALMAGGYVPSDIFDQFRQEAIEDAEKAKELFLKITEAGGVHS
jgi:nucleotide-binding universal stress UspA family protein